MDRHLESAPTIDEIMDEVMQALQANDREPGEFTSVEFGKKHKMTTSRAYEFLERGVRRGVLSKRSAVVGRPLNLYRKI